MKFRYKFLGITFDKKLTWGQQLEHTEEKYLKIIYLIHFMAIINGVLKNIITMSLQNVNPLFKPDYGSKFYMPVVPVHNIALRICLVGFKSSPSENLQI